MLKDVFYLLNKLINHDHAHNACINDQFHPEFSSTPCSIPGYFYIIIIRIAGSIPYDSQQGTIRHQEDQKNIKR
jgi:hypothetical protein